MTWPNGKAYFFRGWQYEGYDVAADRVGVGYPLATAENWPLLWPNGLDASVLWPNGKAYFFRGNQYQRYDSPQTVSTTATRSRSPATGLACGARAWTRRGLEQRQGVFFRGNEYVSYDIATDRVDPGFPKRISAGWRGVWADRVDAVVLWNNGKAYFFRDDEYMRYDLVTRRVDPGYPLPIAGNWPGLFRRVDTAVVWNNGKAYFFRGAKYSRYDVAADRVDPTYPYPIGNNWPGLPGRVR